MTLSSIEGVDAVVDHRLIEVKAGVNALRPIRLGLMQLAFQLARHPNHEAYLVLPEAKITEARLRKEWELAKTVLRSELSKRLNVCLGEGDRFVGIPRDPDLETQRILAEVVRRERPVRKSRLPRADASMIVLKVLLLHWLTDEKPVTMRWLEKATGFSYPTIANSLRPLGGKIERQSNRSIRLRWFPREEYLRLVTSGERSRSTFRYVDRSGQSRTLEAGLKRLEKLAPPDVALGGVLGARHYFPGLDLVGLPRLDLSIHCPGKDIDLDFINRLDPALKRIDDPLEPAGVVVHAVRHAESFFTPRKGGLAWADPVECLLDLHEAKLEVQASQFLENLLQKTETRNARN